ncbi:extracellular solute-binding protein [Desulfomicrobium baculatum]|uniref:Extracellular solute-binding protein family 5 n=1 Tax=Desulfomicrobium baculatum (strain DSM 4028 / VKM B-1378 / X) TaxID=525897 RepID=C7LSQ5_DESBD|nr:extracellular solute-binding protein [Desulfomicrobium baculatum]ACU89446.1 extracellular solute-binding protein family 5 [Desulfomicrobium baculatum DSM 4028]
MKHFFLLVLLLGSALPASAGDFSHALAMNGQPRYSADFTHFDYANPDAPKGGTVRLAATGTFDSFNPYIVKGNSADGLGLLFDTLTEQSLDEPFTEYGLLADRIELAKDRSSMSFHLRKEARFHDGSPVTAQDVAFTFKTLLAQGNPHYAQYYADVERVDVVDTQTVTFVFKPQSSQELPLILGQLPVLSEASWQGRDFSASSLDIPMGSGPYRIGEFKAGQRLTFVRDPGYWGRDLPVNTGRHNFDSIIYDYYRDLTVTLEAFKAGEYDFRQEYNSKQWATGYTGPAVEAGLIRTENIPHKLSQGMQAFVFNTRRAIFADPLVRQALNFAFDFEWSNKNLFYGQYVRSTSFFSNSDMAASGLPTEEEMALLEPLELPEKVYTKEFSLPVTDGNGNIRDNLREAADLLRQAGWSVEGGKLVKDGRPFVFEMLLVQPDFERVVLPFQRNLTRLGITMSVRMVDTSQYLERLRGFDFDMIVSSFPQSLSPGNEQRSFWHSASADMPGSRNYCGIKNPAIDKLVDLVIAAPDRDALILRCKALDRALLWGWYVIPHWHATSWRVAYWDKFGRPDKLADYGLDFQSWWVDPDKERELTDRRGRLGSK